MEAVFLKMFNLSITASWLILAIIIIRFVFKKAPKWINCALWALVAVRLICPFSIESVVSLIPSMETVPENIGYSDLPNINSGISTVNQAINPIISQNLAPNAGDSVNPMQVVTAVASVIWLAGVVVLLIYSLVSYIRIRRKVKVSMPFGGKVLLCDGISSPFILGIFKPKIYLPSAMPEEQRQYVIAHENAHLKRCDHWWKPLGFFVLTAYWFNPLIWVAYILLCRDIELACDERVIKAMGEESKKSYSEALLSCSVPRKMITACPVAFGEVGVKDRIKNVLSYKKPAFWIIIAAIVISIIAAACFMTNPSNSDINGKVFDTSKYYYSRVIEEEKAAKQNVRFSITDDFVMAKIQGENVTEIGVIAPIEENEIGLVDMVMHELPFYYRIIGFDKVYIKKFAPGGEHGVMTYLLLLMRNGDIIGGCLPRSEYAQYVFKLTEKSEIKAFSQNVFTVTESGKQSVKEVTCGELAEKFSLDIYYFGLSEVNINIDGQTVELRKALADGMITAETVAQNADEDALLGRCIKEEYGINGYSYQYDDFVIIDRTSVITSPQDKDRREIYICVPGTTYYSLNDYLYSEDARLQKAYSLEDAISSAINERHGNGFTGEYGFNSFCILQTDYSDTKPNVKVYIQYAYCSYNYVDGSPEEAGSLAGGAVLTFNFNGDVFVADEFVQWNKGNKDEEDMKLLDSLISNNNVDAEKLVDDCEIQAKDYFGHTISTRIGDDIYIFHSNGHELRYALIHGDGTEIIPYFEGCMYPLYESSVENSNAVFIQPFSGEKNYVADLTGEIIIAPDDYDRLNINSVLGAFEGVKDGTLYVFDSKGNIVETRDKNIKPVGAANKNGFQLVSKYESGRVTYGVVNAESKTVVPCEYSEIKILNADRIVARKGQLDGLDITDSVLIYDADGNVVCKEGEFTYLAFTENADIGIGIKIDSADFSVMKHWLVDTDGNRLTDEYYKIEAISDKRFMAKTSDETVFYAFDGTELERYKINEIGYTENVILEKSGDYIYVNAERNNLEGYSSKKYGSDRVAFKVDNIDDWRIGDVVLIVYKLKFEPGNPPKGELIDIMLSERFESVLALNLAYVRRTLSQTAQTN